MINYATPSNYLIMDRLGLTSPMDTADNTIRHSADTSNTVRIRGIFLHKYPESGPLVPNLPSRRFVLLGAKEFRFQGIYFCDKANGLRYTESAECIVPVDTRWGRRTPRSEIVSVVRKKLNLYQP